MEVFILPFGDIEAAQLHEMYRLRTAIFVVEQNCAYQEVDRHDLLSRHLLGYQGSELVATARICPPNTVYSQLSIGRISVREDQRGKGLGKEVFAAALKDAQKHYPGQPIKLQAQCYLEQFYAEFGFKTISAPYPDVGIMHVDMIL